MLFTRITRKALRLAGRPDLADRLTVYQYQKNRLVFSYGYSVFRNQEILRMLANDQTLEGFRTRQSLAPGYGLGLDERIVEYPWPFSHLNKQPE